MSYLQEVGRMNIEEQKRENNSWAFPIHNSDVVVDIVGVFTIVTRWWHRAFSIIYSFIII